MYYVDGWKLLYDSGRQSVNLFLPAVSCPTLGIAGLDNDGWWWWYEWKKLNFPSSPLVFHSEMNKRKAGTRKVGPTQRGYGKLIHTHNYRSSSIHFAPLFPIGSHSEQSLLPLCHLFSPSCLLMRIHRRQAVKQQGKSRPSSLYSLTITHF